MIRVEPIRVTSVTLSSQQHGLAELMLMTASSYWSQTIHDVSDLGRDLWLLVSLSRLDKQDTSLLAFIT